jgi:hypothetical protein
MFSTYFDFRVIQIRLTLNNWAMMAKANLAASMEMVIRTKWGPAFLTSANNLN